MTSSSKSIGPRVGAAWMALAALLAGGLARAAPSPEPGAQPAHGGRHRLAVVLGNNAAAPGSGLADLAFADDDALAYAELFRDLGADDVSVLTTLDADTLARRTESGAVPELRPPTRAELQRALAHAAQRATAWSRAGESADVYLVLSAHGSLDATEARLHLADGPFTRGELFTFLESLEPMDGVVAHVVVDACYSYSLVARGRTAAHVSDRTYESFAHAGFLLSTDAARETYESDRFRAGVFSHLVRSLMRGAADVDAGRPDGVISYEEAYAFLVTAQAAAVGVSGPAPFVRAPRTGSRALVDLRGRPCVEVGADLAGHYIAGEGATARLVDFNKTEGQPLQLAMTAGETVTLRRDPDDPGASHGDLYAATCNPSAPQPLLLAHARGEPAPPDPSLAGLFRTPLRADVVPLFRSLLLAANAPAPAAHERNPWPTRDLWLAGGAAAGVVLGGVSLWRREAALDFPARTTPADVQAQRRNDAASWQTAAGAGFAVAGVLAASAAVDWWLSSRDVSAGAALAPGGGAAWVELRWGGP